MVSSPTDCEITTTIATNTANEATNTANNTATDATNIDR
jgi:hypothetical protein